MANTVNYLNFANTFGDWVVTTNNLARENNDLAANNYIKPAGTLFLNDPNLGLQIANNAIIAGQLQVQGIGSSAYIQNNLRVDTQVFFQNTVLGLINSGQLISNGRITASGSGTGLAVANNTTIGGTLSVGGNETVGGTLIVTGATTLGNSLAVTGPTTVSNTISVSDVGTFSSNVNVSRNVNVTEDTFTTKLFAGDSITGRSLIITNESDLNGTLAVTGNTSLANNLLVSGQTTVNALQANNSVNTATLSVTGTSFTNVLQANSSVNTAVLSVTGNTFTNFLTANSAISGATLSLSGSTLNAPSAVGTFQSLTTSGAVTVGGNFVITGTTVYATNTFTLSAGVSTPITSFFTVNRPAAANASIRWSEISKYWDMNNINTGIFYRVLTDEYRSDVTTINGTTNIATSNAVFYLQSLANTTNTNISVIQGVNATQNTRLNSIETNNINQNTSISIIQGVDATQNIRLNSIETNNINQNTAISIIQGVDNTQNATITAVNQYATSAYNQANTTQSGLTNTTNYFQGLNNTQNTTIGIIQSVDVTQNTRLFIIESVNATQNTRLNSIETINSSQNTTITHANQFAGGAYNTANGANGLAQGAYNTANNRVSSVSGSAGRITSSGGLTPAIDLATAGPGASSATNASLSIDVYGRVTALSSGAAAVTSITGTTNQINTTGGTTPTLSLPQNIHTGASVQFGSFGVGTTASGTAGEIRATNNITAFFSDERLKTKTGDIKNAVDKVCQIETLLYHANETAVALGYDASIQEVGVTAQSVQKVQPEIVVPAPIDDRYLTVRYEKLVPLLIEAIKELKAEIDILKNK
jgi:hypothetical protein